MKCPDEFVLAQYGDGELPKEELGILAPHIDFCPSCRSKVAAFRAEARILAESIQSVEWREFESSCDARLPELMRPAAALFIVSLCLRLGMDLVRKFEVPAVLEWLSPLSLSGSLNWIVNSLFYVIENGGSIVTSYAYRAGTMLASLFMVWALFALGRRATRIAAPVLFSSLLMVALTAPVYAIDIRKAEDDEGITIPQGETINDTLIVFAESVDIKGTVNGDVVAFTRQLRIEGAVQGNVIGFAQRIEMTGTAQNSVYAFGQSLRIAGTVQRTLWGFGQTVTLDKTGRTDDAMLFGSDVIVDGTVGRDVAGFAGTMEVQGRIERDLRFRGRKLAVRAPAHVGRDLSARVHSGENLQIDPEATIGGKRGIEFEPPQPSKYLTAGFYVGQIFRLAGAFLTGFLLFRLFPNARHAPLGSGREALLSGGIGFLALVATPIAAVILVITVVGLPIAFIAFGLWLIALYLAHIVVARHVGEMIAPTGSRTGTALPLLIGLAIVIVAVNLPFIGGILSILITLVGLGALVVLVRRTLFPRPVTEA